MSRPESNTSAGRPLPVERLEAAIAEFDNQIELPAMPADSKRLEELLKNALLLIDNGDYEMAVNILNHILSCDPEFSDALKWIAYCFAQQGNFPNAVHYYERYAAERPGEESWFLLGEALYKCGSESEALESYKLALECIDYDSPYLFEIYKNVGNILLKRGDLDGAEEHYNRAYTVQPHSDILLVNYGTLELQRGNIEASSERFQAALELNRSNDKAWLGLAIVHRQKGDFELAWGAIESALDINKFNLPALRAAVEWGWQDGCYERPIRRLRAYLSSFPYDLDLSYSLAGLLVQTSRLSEARELIDRILSRNSGRADALELRDVIVRKMEAPAHA